MIRLRSLLTAAAISLPLLMVVFSAAGQIQDRYVPGELVVKPRRDVPRAQLADVEAALLPTVSRRLPSIGAEVWSIRGMTVAEALRRYQNDARFDYVEPNYIIQLDQTFPSDPQFPDMWALHNTGQTGGAPDADIDAPEGWDLETGDSVVVAIIDSGIDWMHEDLATNIFINHGEIPNNGLDDDANGFIDDVRGWDFRNGDNNPTDDAGHGTHVAGTAGAIGNNGVGVVGVSWRVRLMPLKFLSAAGSGTTVDAIRCIDYATMMGVRVINASWGGAAFSQALYDAVQTAGTAGILFVAAAGNTARDADISPHYPAAFDLDNIISIANTTHNDQLSPTSTFGLVTVDLAAPGANILSTFPGNIYGLNSGTSMAAPHVSGAISLIWSSAPLLDHLGVKNIIMSSVDPLPVALAGRTVTGGRLNIFSSLAGLDDIVPSPVSDLMVVATGSNTTTLAWTASGDDSTVGTASSYDIRYSLSPIDEANFDLTTAAAPSPLPQPSGTAETFQVQGLDFNTTYFFALRVLDERGNASQASNSPTGTTLGVPRISFAPDSLGDSLLTGGTAVHNVTIRNTASGTLDFSFPGLDPVPVLPHGAAGIEGAAPSWLHAVPNSGRVVGGDSVIVEMRFDATGLAGGNFAENVVITSNDTLQPLVTLIASLHVTAAPDIVVSRDSVDFGTHFIGTATMDTILIANSGTSVLNVSGINVDNADYTADSSGFSLLPSQSFVLTVAFAPSTAGPSLATLTVSSDDPDTPVSAVSLAGAGLEPPVIVVDPDSLDQSLVFGTTTTRTLSIQNNGGTDLIFDIGERVGGLSAAGVRVVTHDVSRDVTPVELRLNQTASNTPSYDSGRAPLWEPQAPDVSMTRTAPAGNLRILLLHAGDVTDIQGRLLVFADVTTVDTFNGAVGTPLLALLQVYTAVIIVVNSPFLDPVSTGNVLADYVDAGGGVVMTLASFINGFDIRGRFLTGGYFPFNPGSGPVGMSTLGSFDPAHPIMRGVTAATGDLLGATTLAAGAEFVAEWSNGLPFIATQLGKVVGVNAFVAGSGFWAGDIPLILRNAVAWTASSDACWLAAEPTAGTVPTGGSALISLTFDATSISCVTAGEFFDTLVVASNDPLTPEVLVPVRLQVAGAPDIALSNTMLDYGAVFIGVTAVDTVVVSNQGTDPLTVSGVTVDNTVYGVDSTGFVLGVGGSRELAVSFSPIGEGSHLGTLTLASDDPDTPLLNLPLAGKGLTPPA